MDYTIQIDKLALKALKSLDKSTQQSIIKKIDSLAKNPRPPKSVKIKGQDGIWRIRDKGFRIAYAVIENKLLILVVHIGDRKNFYDYFKRVKFKKSFE